MSPGLPGGTVSISNQVLTITDSKFVNLTPNAPASLILIGSNVTVQSAYFADNKQGTAGII